MFLFKLKPQNKAFLADVARSFIRKRCSFLHNSHQAAPAATSSRGVSPWLCSSRNGKSPTTLYIVHFTKKHDGHRFAISTLLIMGNSRKYRRHNRVFLLPKSEKGS